MKRLLFVISISLAFPIAGEAGDEKLVMAHYMTDMVPRTRGKLIRWIDPELADPRGSTAALGGLHQAVPMASLHLENADLEKAVDFEIRAARQLGIDGFQFYYPLVDNTPSLAKSYNVIIAKFIELSDARYAGFRISLCLAHPATGKPTSEKEKISLWSPPIRELLNSTGKSPAWLRAGSGSLLFYLWVGDALADGIDGLNILACFASNMSGAARIERLGARRFEVRLEQPFAAGRGRINCTLQANGNRWRWFGRQFFIPTS